MRRITTLIFDMDGTLVDTEPAAVRAIHQACKKFHIKVGKKDAQKIAGRKWEVVFELLKTRSDRNIWKPLAITIMRNYRAQILKKLPRIRGSKSAIRKLSQDYRLALVSGSRRSEINIVLRRLQIKKYFELILGAEDYAQSKPSPEGYKKAMKLLRISTKEAVVFEDSSAGILAAKRAGLKVIAIRAANHFKLDQSQAHSSIHDFRSLSRVRAILKKL